MTQADRLLYWFITRTPREKFWLVAAILVVVVGSGMVFLAALDAGLAGAGFAIPSTPTPFDS